MELEELLKIIGGKQSTIKIPGIEQSLNGVCDSWGLEDIKGDGVSYNLFKKSMWRGHKHSNDEYFWDVSKITVTDDEMEFDNFTANEDKLYEWLQQEFKSFVRDKKINDILN
jgi:hypothetical protein